MRYCTWLCLEAMVDLDDVNAEQQQAVGSSGRGGSKRPKIEASKLTKARRDEERAVREEILKSTRFDYMGSTAYTEARKLMKVRVALSLKLY